MSVAASLRLKLRLRGGPLLYAVCVVTEVRSFADDRASA
jgi:hypothetical protein